MNPPGFWTDTGLTGTDCSICRRCPDHPSGPFDELFDSTGAVRAQWSGLIDGLERMGDAGLRQADQRVRTLIDDDGITYNAPTGTTTQQSRWELDCVPLLFDGSQWQRLEKGIEQRARVLDALLSDVYADQKAITSGLVPPEMIYGHPGYVRKAARFPQVRSHMLFMHACDIGRVPSGEYLVYSDRDAGAVRRRLCLADRHLMSRAFPRLLQRCVPRPMSAFAATVRIATFEYAPQGIEEPTVAVLTPGSLSETAFDQAYLASILGFPLVEAADLVVRDGAVYMRSLGTFKTARRDHPAGRLRLFRSAGPACRFPARCHRPGRGGLARFGHRREHARQRRAREPGVAHRPARAQQTFPR